MLARPRSVSQESLDRLVLCAVVAIAAALRFVDLPTRGTWDSDQGHDMLVLRALVRAVEIPTLGPPTSIGDFHHGVLYYYLLAPAAALTGLDPLGVVGAIALAGVAAVAVTWWLARSIGGSLAGAVAGLLMAVSASAIDESTFIWNPNLIALSSSVAVAAAWRAWTTGRSRWWIVAGMGAIVTMHCHVLGSALLPAIVGLLVADYRRHGPGPRRSAAARAAGVIALLLAASYVPLVIHELTANFSETRAALEFITGGGAPTGVSLPTRFFVVALRVLAWPLVGLVTSAFSIALVAAALVVGFLVWLARFGTDRERIAARWFGATLAWSIVVLTFAASGLATVVPGLPNDHYHAFADPIVFVVVGLGVAGLARWRLPATELAAAAARLVGPALATALVAFLVLFNLSIAPPPVARDGGWPEARAAAARVIAATSGQGRLILESLPRFKPADALRFPLVAAGADVAPAGFEPGGSELPARVVLCDGLFEKAIGASCGGPAEDAAIDDPGLRLVDRFEAAPGRWVSVYGHR